MKVSNRKTMVLITLTGLLLMLSFCSGCAGLMLSPIYNSMLGGALVGGIIGHQSGEALAGALVGGAIMGGGELLKQTDELAREEQEGAMQEKECKKKLDDENVIVEIHNSNGSFVPVELVKKDDVYIGPKGEHYRHLPTAEQLRPLYGIQ